MPALFHKDVDGGCLHQALSERVTLLQHAVLFGPTPVNLMSALCPAKQGWGCP